MGMALPEHAGKALLISLVANFLLFSSMAHVSMRRAVMDSAPAIPVSVISLPLQGGGKPEKEPPPPPEELPIPEEPSPAPPRTEPVPELPVPKEPPPVTEPAPEVTPEVPVPEEAPPVREPAPEQAPPEELPVPEELPPSVEPSPGPAPAPETQAPTDPPLEPYSSARPAPLESLTVLPSFTTRVSPAYPESARAAGREGRVVLDVLIGRDGKPEDIRIAESGGESFDRSAVDALKGSAFSPGEMDGKPVPVRVRVPFTFRIR